MKRLRIFERFGFNLPKGKLIKTPVISIIKDYQEWNFDVQQFDWFNSEVKKLTDFDPLSPLLKLLTNNIDVGFGIM